MKEYDHTDDNGTWHVREYELNEYMFASTSAPPHSKNLHHSERDAQRSVGYWDTAWRGGTLEEAKTLRSWPEGRERLAKIDFGDVSLPSIATTKRVRCWSDNGDEFDRDRFDAGYPDCWQSRKRRRTRTGGSTIRITVELSSGWRKSADDLTWSGLAALKLADTLEEKGYRVEIDVVASCRNLKGRQYAATPYKSVDVIRVKEAGDPLNIDALLFSIACPLFYRFHNFASKLRRPVRASDGLGLPGRLPAGLEGDIHIAKVFTQAEAQGLVRSALSQKETV